MRAVTDVNKVIVQGLGTMGVGWVTTFLQAGFTVYGLEIDPGARKRAEEEILMRLAKAHKRAVEKDPLKPELPDSVIVWENFHHIDAVEQGIEADIFLEVIPEDLKLKKENFSTLSSLLPREMVVWTNTSCLNIEEMARAYGSPGMFIGTHGMNPVNLTKAVEVVEHNQVLLEVLEWTKAVIRKIGKEPLVAKNVPGFVVNKLFIPWAMDAIGILERKENDVGTVDRLLKLSLGHPQGVFLLLDRIGLDVMVAVGDALYKDTQDPRHKPPTLLCMMVAIGNLGFKAGKGFYDWSSPKEPKPVSLGELTRLLKCGFKI